MCIHRGKLITYMVQNNLQVWSTAYNKTFTGVELTFAVGTY